MWARNGGLLLEPERVGAVVAAVGLDASALLAATQTPVVKDQVRRNTEELLALEGFGVPSLLADGDLFFGLDSESSVRVL